jgi:hypothetical protein
MLANEIRPPVKHSRGTRTLRSLFVFVTGVLSPLIVLMARLAIFGPFHDVLIVLTTAALLLWMLARGRMRSIEIICAGVISVGFCGALAIGLSTVIMIAFARLVGPSYGLPVGWLWLFALPPLCAALAYLGVVLATLHDFGERSGVKLKLSISALATAIVVLATGQLA